MKSLLYLTAAVGGALLAVAGFVHLFGDLQGPLRAVGCLAVGAAVAWPGLEVAFLKAES